MLKNVIDLASILERIESVKSCSLINDADKQRIFYEMKSFIPDERLSGGHQETRKIILKVLEVAINAGAKKAPKARKEIKVSTKKAT